MADLCGGGLKGGNILLQLKDALLQFAVRDTKELDALLAEIKTYGDSRTSVELKTLFDIKEIPLP